MSVAECVQPAPWVAATSPVDGNLDVVTTVEEVVDRIAVTPGHDHGRSAELVQPLGELTPRAGACERLGFVQVRGDHGRKGKSRETSASTASFCKSFAPELATMTGSTTSGTRCRSGNRRPPRSAAGRRASRSWPRPRRCRRKRPRAARARRSAAPRARQSPPCVFCAVSATIALMPWQPAAANAFRSAWIPHRLRNRSLQSSSNEESSCTPSPA